MRKFLQEFQAFISKGNVLDLAVAVIIGAAFSKIVDSLVKDIVNPLLGVLVGRPDFTNLFLVLKEAPNYTGPRTYDALVKAGATVFGYGAFLTAVVQFLLLAFVIFWLVKVVTAARDRIAREADRLLAEKTEAQAEKKKADEAAAAAAAAAAPAPAPAASAPSEEELALLREIRDLLKARHAAGAAGTDAPRETSKV